MGNKNMCDHDYTAVYAKQLNIEFTILECTKCNKKVLKDIWDKKNRELLNLGDNNDY